VSEGQPVLGQVIIDKCFYKVKLQLQHQVHKADRQFKGPIDCAKQIFRAQGVRGFWKGLAGSLAFRANFFWMFMTIEVEASPVSI
jgi:solute carrier family 25 (mitochondrial carnitine/acylcarnitine transporter), member 20/29